MFFICADDFLFRRQRVPVLLDSQMSRTIKRQHMARGKLVYVLEKSFGRWSRQKSQVVVMRLFIDVWSDGRMLQNRFYLRSEDETTIAEKVVERLNTDAIANQDEPFSICIPQRDCIVTFDLVNKIEPTFFVEMKNCFRIGARRILVA